MIRFPRKHSLEYRYASRLEEILSHDNMEEESLSFCERYGEREPRLWIQLLSHVSRTSNNVTYIRNILDRVSKSKVLRPIEIVDILGQKKSRITLEAILPYVKNTIVEDGEDKSDDYMVRAKELRENIQKLQDTKRLDFQSTICEYCKKSIQLPLVQFISGDAYHFRCMKKKKKRDESSSSSYDKMIQALRRKGKDYNAFLETLDCDDEDERYNRMMGYFGVVGVDDFIDEEGESVVAGGGDKKK